ncbi:MAG TPA: hypothetical protein GXX20_01705 [Clostridiaceae bacterium]|nr:hypothetical protein [Clostridiaceae bacterium]
MAKRERLLAVLRGEKVDRVPVSPFMMGPNFFKEHILAMEIEHCRIIRDMGAAYLYHNCGDAAALLPLYSDIKMNVYESMTPPPYGDTDFDTALSTIDKSITLCGNIDQVSFLKEATPEENIRAFAEAGLKYGKY